MNSVLEKKRGGKNCTFTDTYCRLMKKCYPMLSQPTDCSKHISAKAILLPLTIYKPHAREQICVEKFFYDKCYFLMQMKKNLSNFHMTSENWPMRNLPVQPDRERKFVQDLWKISSRFLRVRVVWCFYRASEPSELAVSDNFCPFRSILTLRTSVCHGLCVLTVFFCSAFSAACHNQSTARGP